MTFFAEGYLYFSVYANQLIANCLDASIYLRVKYELLLVLVFLGQIPYITKLYIYND